MSPIESGNRSKHAGIKIVCSAPGAFHERYGRSTVATFTRSGLPAGYVDARTGEPVGGTQAWQEVAARSTRTERAEERWHEELTADEEEALLYGRADAPRSPFGGTLIPGRRPVATTYLRGDVPADDRHVETALTRGEREGAAGSAPARPEDLAGRARVELHCKCGQGASRRGERLWTALDLLAAQGEPTVELRVLRRVLDNLGPSGR